MNSTIGRNSPCTCGSKKRFKECCGKLDRTSVRIPAHIVHALNRKAQEDKEFEDRHGQGKQIIHANVNGHKMVAVGNELYADKKWKTFPDFLIHYLTTTLGSEWGNEESKKPLEKKHEILKWYNFILSSQKSQNSDIDGIFKLIPCGAMKAWYQLAYDLYTLRHNQYLQDVIVSRLKNKDQFQGALYEANVTAILIRSGYEIEFEDETDGSKKHPEFIATHKNHGLKIAIEAKSRHRPGILGQSGEIPSEDKITVDIRRILSSAFSKSPDLPYVVFVNVNLPSIKGDYTLSPWFAEIENTILNREKRLRGNEKFPASAIIFTNAPYHWHLDSEIKDHGWTYGRYIKLPRIPLPNNDIVKQLVIGTRQNGNIPNEFPSE